MRAVPRHASLVWLALALAACAGSGSMDAARRERPPDGIWDEKTPYGFHRAMAQTLLRTGKPGGAVQHIQQLVTMRGEDDADPHYMMAKAQLALGLHEESRKALQRAIARDAKHAPAISLLGVLEDRLGNRHAALRAHRRAAALDPQNAGYRNNLGFCLFLQKRYGEAVTAYREALERDPSMKRIHNNLGFSFAGQGKLDLAYKHFRLAGPAAAADNNMGFALERRGELNRAYFYYLRAASSQPTAPEAQENLARVCKRLGKPLPQLLRSSGQKGSQGG